MNELLELFSPNFEAYLQGPLLLIALVAIGLVVGILTGLFGVGGAFLINPLLIIVLGMQETLVTGSGLTFTIGASSAGMARHWRMKNMEVRAMLYLSAGALPAVWLGHLAHGALSSALGPAGFAVAYQALYLVELLVTVLVVYSHAGRRRSGRPLLQRMKPGPYVDLCGGELKHVSLPGLVFVGGSIGLAKGLLGIGGGVLFMPLLLVVVGLSVHQAVGTSLGVIFFSSIFGTVLYGIACEVNLLLVMMLLVGSGVGIQIGAWMCQRLHSNKLQRYFVYVVLLATVLVAVDLATKIISR